MTPAESRVIEAALAHVARPGGLEYAELAAAVRALAAEREAADESAAPSAAV